MNPKLLEALAYLDQGWSIFPCKPNRKDPLVDWGQYSKERPTREQVTKWWTENPDANIGIVTGKISGLVVVDVDTYKGGIPDSLPYTGTRAKTARGGLHFLYRYPPGVSSVGNTTNDTRAPNSKGVDVRGDGGYIVAAPSVTEDGAYEWLDTSGLGLAPKWVTEGKTTTKEKPDEHAGWLSEIFSTGFKEGERNQTAARLAGYLYGKRIPMDIAVTMAIGANEKSEEPLELSELRRTVESVYKTSKARDKGKGGPEDESTKGEPFKVIQMAEYMAKHGDYVAKWQIKNWLPDKTIAFAVAPPEHYKTWMLFDLAVSIATGCDFMGEKVEDPGPVILVQQEDFPGQTTMRLEAILSSKLGKVEPNTDSDTLGASFPALADIPIYLPDGGPLRFDNPDCMEALEDLLKELKPSMVILDPLYSAVPHDNFMADAVPHLFKLKQLRNEYGCTFFLAHHTNKGGSEDRQGLWGSQFLNALLETGWQIRATSDNPKHDKVKLIRHFKMGGRPPVVQVDFDIDTTNEQEYIYSAIAYNIHTPESAREGMEEELKKTGKVDISNYILDVEDAAEALVGLAMGLELETLDGVIYERP